MLHRIKANCAAFESTLYPGFNIRDLEDLQQSQNLNELTFALFTAVLHQSPDKRGVPLPVKMVSQLTQTWHSQVRSFC